MAVEYIAEEVVVHNKRVSFDQNVLIRPIPAAGAQRPTKFARKLQKPWADESSDEDATEERGINSIVMVDTEYEGEVDYVELDQEVEKRKPKIKEGVRPPRLAQRASRRNRLSRPTARHRVSSRDSGKGDFVLRGSVTGSSDCSSSSLDSVERVRSKGEHERTSDWGESAVSEGSGSSGSSSTSTTSLPSRRLAGLTHCVAQSPRCKIGPA